MKNYLKRFVKSFIGVLGALISVTVAASITGLLGSAIERKYGGSGVAIYAFFLIATIVSGLLAIEPKS